MVSVDSFPDDDIERVIYLFGGIQQNTSDSTNPLVEVLLLEIDQSNPKRLNTNDNFGTYLVTLKDLEIFKQWSIWKGNQSTGKVFDFGDEIREEKFEFNLETNPAYSINCSSKFASNGIDYIPFKYRWIPKVIKSSQDPKVRDFNFYSFANSKYCVLRTLSHQKIIIHSLNVFHSLYVPSRKDIRGMLIYPNFANSTFENDLDTLVSKFVEYHNFEEVQGQPTIFIKLKSKYEKHLGSAATIFLANLAFNKKVREKVISIRKSLENVKSDSKGKPYPNRLPTVEPPHSKNLRVHAKGIWLDAEKTRFLVIEVSKFSGLNDFPVVRLIPSNEKNDKAISEVILRETRELQASGNEHINTQQDPSRKSAIVKKMSDIVTDIEECDYSLVLMEHSASTPNQILYGELYQEGEVQNDVSSGNEYGESKATPKRLENSEPSNTGRDLFELIWTYSIWYRVLMNPNGYLESYYCLNKKGVSEVGYYLIDLKEVVNKHVSKSWIDYKGGRKALFLLLKFKNRNEFVYFIDVEKGKQATCAFLLVSPSLLSMIDIKRICIAIESTKGTKSWIEKFLSDFHTIKPINHNAPSQSEWCVRLESEFYKLGLIDKVKVKVK